MPGALLGTQPSSIPANRPVLYAGLCEHGALPTACGLGAGRMLCALRCISLGKIGLCTMLHAEWICKMQQMQQMYMVGRVFTQQENRTCCIFETQRCHHTSIRLHNLMQQHSIVVLKPNFPIYSSTQYRMFSGIIEPCYQQL